MTRRSRDRGRSSMHTPLQTCEGKEMSLCLQTMVPSSRIDNDNARRWHAVPRCLGFSKMQLFLLNCLFAAVFFAVAHATEHAGEELFLEKSLRERTDLICSNNVLSLNFELTRPLEEGSILTVSNLHHSTTDDNATLPITTSHPGLFGETADWMRTEGRLVIGVVDTVMPNERVQIDVPLRNPCGPVEKTGAPWSQMSIVQLGPSAETSPEPYVASLRVSEFGAEDAQHEDDLNQDVVVDLDGTPVLTGARHPTIDCTLPRNIVYHSEGGFGAQITIHTHAVINDFETGKELDGEPVVYVDDEEVVRPPSSSFNLHYHYAGADVFGEGLMGEHTLKISAVDFTGEELPFALERRFWVHNFDGGLAILWCKPRQLDVDLTHFNSLAIDPENPLLPVMSADWRRTIACTSALFKEDPSFVLPWLIQAQWFEAHARWGQAHASIESLLRFDLPDIQNGSSTENLDLRTSLKSYRDRLAVLEESQYEYRGFDWQTLTAETPPAPEGCLPQGKPYLSIIMLMRHDDSPWCHSGYDNACISRFRTCLTTLMYQLSTKGIHAEILVLDWAPLGEPWLSLAEVVKKYVMPSTGVVVRVFSVPHAVHASFWNPANFTVLEWPAKNALARRARGEFLVITNPDDVFSDSLMDTFARKDLRDNVVYVGLRGGVNGVPSTYGTTPFSMTKYSNEHSVFPIPKQIRWHFNYSASCAGVDGREPLTAASVDYNVTRLKELAFDDAAGDCTVISLDAFKRLRGYSEYPSLSYMDGGAIFGALANGMGHLVLMPPCGVAHQHHERSHKDLPQVLGYEGYRQGLANLTSMGDKANHAVVIERGEGGQDKHLPHTERPWWAYNGEDWGLRDHAIDETVMFACSRTL